MVGLCLEGNRQHADDGRLLGRSVGSDYIITLTVSTQWLRCSANLKLPQS